MMGRHRLWTIVLSAFALMYASVYVAVPTLAAEIVVSDLYGSNIYSVESTNGNTVLGTPFPAPRGLVCPFPDEVYVVDNYLRAIYRSEPDRKGKIVLSQSPDKGSGPAIATPRGITFANDGYLYVTNHPTLHIARIDRFTGDRTFLSGTGPDFVHPLGIVADNFGYLWVTDSILNALFRVEISTGNRTIISNDSTGSGTTFDTPRGVAIEDDGNLLVADSGRNCVFRVDPATGNRTVVTGAGVGTGPELQNPDGLLLKDSDTLYITDNKTDDLLVCTLSTGDRELVSSLYGLCMGIDDVPEWGPELYWTPGIGWDFEQDGNAEGWKANGHFGSVHVTDGALSGTVTGPYSSFLSPYGLQLSGYRWTVVEARMKISAGDYVKLGYQKDGQDFVMARLPIVNHSDYITYRYNFADDPNYTGTIQRFKVYPIAPNGTQVDLDSFRVYRARQPMTQDWEYSADGNIEGWFAHKHLSTPSVFGGMLSVQSTGTDPILLSPKGLNLDADLHDKLVIRMMATSGDSVVLYFAQAGQPFTGANKLQMPLKSTGDFETYILDMSSVPGWTGAIDWLRLDPTNASGAVIRVDYVAVQ